KTNAEGFLAWAQVWVKLGCVLNECDRPMSNRIHGFLDRLANADVPELGAATMLLQLSREGRAELVADQLAALHKEPSLHGFGGWLPFICDEMIPARDGFGFSLASNPPDTASGDDFKKAMRALGYRVAGEDDRPTVVEESKAGTEIVFPPDEETCTEPVKD